jgi:hypothetical protein
MTGPPFAWFYICSEEAEPILKEIFQKGVGPGSIITISDEDFETLSLGFTAVPVHIRGDSQILKPRLVVPTAS